MFNNLFKWFINKAGFDGAVVFSLLTKLVQSTSGLITLAIISKELTSEIQGYFYTFISLLALSSFFELGLYIVIVNFVSREWSNLSLSSSGKIMGNAISIARIKSFTLEIAKWYSFAGLLYVSIGGLTGYIFLMQSTSNNIDWKTQWLLTILLGGIQLIILPMLSVIEGCNQTVSYNKFRFIQTIIDGIITWILLLCGLNLWAIVGSLSVRVICSLVYIFYGHIKLFQSIFNNNLTTNIEWRKEIWPMQWRLAIQALLSYFTFSFFVPLIFHFHGAVIAGQIGMTLQIIIAIQTMCMSWLSTKFPIMGSLIAKNDFVELDRIWLNSTKIMFIFSIIGNVIFFMFLVVLENNYLNLSQRFLDITTTAIFLIGYSLFQITQAQALYIRAHGKDEFLVVNLTGSILIGIFAYLLGKEYAAIGIAIAFSFVNILFVLPAVFVIWFKFRIKWH